MSTSKMKGNLFYMILVVFIVLLFAGCAKKSIAGDQASKIDLVAWMPGDWYLVDKRKEDTVRYKYVMKFQEENPRVNLSLVSQPTDTIDTLFKAANLAGNGPDIISLWPGSPTMDYVDYLLPLDKYITKEYIDSRFGWEMARVGFTSEGPVYGIPVNAYLYVMYYNKNTMKKVNFDENNPPRSWEEILELCRKLKQAGEVPFYQGGSNNFMAQWGVGTLINTIFGDDYEKMLQPGFVFKGSDFEKAIDLWTQLAKNDYINKDAGSVPTREMPGKFGPSGAAMVLSGNWQLYAMRDQLGDNLGFFKTPCADIKSPYRDYNYAGTGLNYCITKYSKHPDESFKFIEIMASPEYMYENEDGDLPNIYNLEANKIPDPLSREVSKILTTGKGMALIDMLPLDVLNEFIQYGNLIVLGRITGQEVCEAMDRVKAQGK